MPEQEKLGLNPTASTSGGWQQTLIDEDSFFLRGVNEGYRTWCLRHQKITLLLKQLDDFKHEAAARLDMRVQQLKAMTLGLPGDPDEATCRTFLDCELVMTTLAAFSGSGSLKGHELKVNENDQTRSIGSLDQCLVVYHEQMHTLDLRVDEVFESKYAADMDLKDFEQLVLQQWQDKKQASELWTKRHAALTGMRSALRAALQQYERGALQKEERRVLASTTVSLDAPTQAQQGATPAEKAETQQFRGGPFKIDNVKPSSDAVLAHDGVDMDGGGEAVTKPEPPMLELRDRDPGVASASAPSSGALARTARETAAGSYEPPRLDPDAVDAIDDIDADLGPPTDQVAHALSDILAEGVTDPKEREEILKREHPGSFDHPHGCRPCHFQGGLCWKGLACSFCHICPKPKRKSKHQRDVDKRRQERYKAVKDDLGITCLDELTKIDDARRQIMTSSEELKKRVKDAYGSKEHDAILDVRTMVTKMKQAVDVYHSSVPCLLNFEDEGDAVAEQEMAIELDFVIVVALKFCYSTLDYEKAVAIGALKYLRTELQKGIADKANVPAEAVEVEFSPGSVIVSIALLCEDLDDAERKKGDLASNQGACLQMLNACAANVPTIMDATGEGVVDLPEADDLVISVARTKANGGASGLARVEDSEDREVRVSPEEEQDDASTVVQGGSAVPTSNFNKMPRKGGQNQRGASGKGMGKWDASKDNSWEEDTGKGWHQYQQGSQAGASRYYDGWGHSGPQVDAYWYGKGSTPPYQVHPGWYPDLASPEQAWSGQADPEYQ